LFVFHGRDGHDVTNAEENIGNREIDNEFVCVVANFFEADISEDDETGTKEREERNSNKHSDDVSFFLGENVRVCIVHFGCFLLVMIASDKNKHC